MPRRKLSQQFTLKGNWRPGAYTPFSQILPHLYQGDCDGCQDSKFLREHHITHVVTMGFVGPPDEVVAALDLRVCEIDVKDSVGARVDKHFDEVVKFIHEGRSSNGTLYVHCYSGTSRSSAFVAAYLMVWLDVSYAEAIRFLRARRPCADPNPSFKKQLKNFGDDPKKIAEFREQLMKMGPAAKRDERLKEDTKLFNEAMAAEDEKDAASAGAQRISVENGVVSAADNDGGEEKPDAVTSEEEAKSGAADAASAEPTNSASGGGKDDGDDEEPLKIVVTAEKHSTPEEETTSEDVSAEPAAAASSDNKPEPSDHDASADAEEAESAEAEKPQESPAAAGNADDDAPDPDPEKPSDVDAKVEGGDLNEEVES